MGNIYRRSEFGNLLSRSMKLAGTARSRKKTANPSIRNS